MKKQSVAMWGILMAIPVVNIIAGLAMYFVLYESLKTLKPDTQRSIGKDLFLAVITCSLFAYVLPFLLMTETIEGAKRVGVDVPDYRGALGLVMLASLGLSFAILLNGMPPEVSFLAGIVTGPLQARFFLTPFNRVAEVFGSQEGQLAKR